MIVDSMTHAEAYKELYVDRENVERWFDHQSDKYRRMALKTTKFPATWWLEYTSVRKNRYLICVICSRRNYDKNHCLSIVALRREAKGYTAYVGHIGKYELVSKTVFLWHVFERYSERAGVDKQGIELIKHFFESHSGGTILKNHKLAGKSVRYKDREHKFLAMNDGVVLGNIENGIFIARTFITYDMATGKQRDVFNNAKSKTLSVDEEIRYVIKKTIENTICYEQDGNIQPVG
jgi:hypothetical protein